MLAGEVIMYRYFVSYSHSEGSVFGFGSIIVTVNKEITNLKDFNSCANWIYDIKKRIEALGKVENVVILNFQLLGKEKAL